MKGKQVLAGLLAGMMSISMSVTGYGASTSNEQSQREIRNANLAMEAAEEGIVLLENENQALPIANKVALFGGGAYATIKGGTGSGDVNQRYTVPIYEGLKNAGVSFTSQAWLDDYKTGFDSRDEAYVTVIKGSFGGSDSYVPKELQLTDTDITEAKKGTDTGIYVVCRTSGEGSDRTEAKGDYYLTDIEKENITKIAKSFEKSIVVLNIGGIIDTKFFGEIEGLDSLVLMSQSGMEGGNALGKVMTGEVSPSGKLTDTWAVDYADYPASATFANNDGDALQENYNEDIYVGYRYFDTFGVTPAYEFGYGLSYTTFETKIDFVTADAEYVTVQATVKNTGSTYSGKEVVEVYFSAPDGTLEKPYQELAAYGKTDVLAPGESQTLTINYKTSEMSSYSEEKAAYIMEVGDYIVRVGNSSRNTNVGAVLTLNETTITEQLSNQLTIENDMELLSKADATPYTYEDEKTQIANAPRVPLYPSFIALIDGNNASEYDDEEITTYLATGTSEAEKEEIKYTGTNKETIVEVPVDESAKLIDVYNGKISMESFVAGLDNETLATLAKGIGYGVTPTPEEGAKSNSVKGAAGETTNVYYVSDGIPSMVLADGPAGVRLTSEYTADDTTYYQYCTAWPIGTALAQTWNTDLIEKVGQAVGEEMHEYGVTLWLAPGMNIHRDPLCGRNFEYYSEDPVLTGTMGTAATLGVQSNPGVGVTIKHYAQNNQETNRNSQNNTISERASREIYLKGYEMAVKSAQPMAIMSSYNKINGVYAAGNFDLLNDIPRGEWGFDGLVMTDWGAKATPADCMHAGNDLIMPGGTRTDILTPLTEKTLALGDVQRSVMRILNIVKQSVQFGYMHDTITVKPYIEQYDDLADLITVSKSEVATDKKEQAKLVAADQKVVLGGKSFTIPVTGGSGTGKLIYTVTSGTNLISYNASTGKFDINKNEKTGEATITIVKQGDNEYKEASITVKVTVSKPKAQWKHDSKGYWYDNGDGTYPSATWMQIGGKKYYFKQNGYMASGWLKLDNVWYYLGKPNDGARKTDWQKVDSKWFYLGKDGKMVTGWKQIGPTWYYLKSNGAMATGWVQVRGTWYYLYQSGAMATGWNLVDGKTYFLNASGSMAKGWKQIKGRWYYFKDNGVMASSEWIGRYYVNVSGIWSKTQAKK